MSILARLANRSSGSPERRFLNVNSHFIPPPMEGMANDYVGQDRALQNLAVYSCIRLLADTIASLPWKCYREDTDGVPNPVEPLPPILRNPWPDLDEFEWKWMVVATLASRGNSFHLVVARDKQFRPTSLLPLSPDDVFVERRGGDVNWTDPVYRVRGTVVNRQDLVHIRRFTMPGEPMGLSPIRQAAIAIGMGLEAENYGYRYFRDSAQPSSVLETDQQLDDAAIRQQQQNWISSHGGRRRPAVLSGGFKWRAISISPEESQFLETRRYQRGEIAMMYGIPPHMIGDTEKSTSWGSGIEQQSIGFAIYTLRPWLSCIENALGQLLPRGQFVRFDTSALLRGDLKARYDAYRVARETGWMNVNEIRVHEQMEGIGPEGDVYLQPMNYAPLGYDPTEQEAPQPVEPGFGDEEQPPELDAERQDGGYTPPAGVRAEARKALQWIKDGHAGSGFTDTGRKRAADLARGASCSRETIGRIANYLGRHESDKNGAGWSPGEEGYPSPGRVAWAAWGGDPAKSWTKSILESDKGSEEN